MGLTGDRFPVTGGAGLSPKVAGLRGAGLVQVHARIWLPPDRMVDRGSPVGPYPVVPFRARWLVRPDDLCSAAALE